MKKLGFLFLLMSSLVLVGTLPNIQAVSTTTTLPPSVGFTYPNDLTGVSNANSLSSFMAGIEVFAPFAEMLEIVFFVVAFGITRLLGGTLAKCILGGLFIVWITSTLFVFSGILNEAWAYASLVLFGLSIVVILNYRH